MSEFQQMQDFKLTSARLLSLVTGMREATLQLLVYKDIRVSTCAAHAAPFLQKKNDKLEGKSDKGRCDTERALICGSIK